ncbi:methyltransferase type 12 [Mycobacterium sp. IS-1742]|uniref:class I SAM-dependent methyltransferase n=1 Tax=Mycobacterium sp. IS-1742 TaxID=1772285 RepID=UPI0007400422|nr:class I SAM-dependent methyltransferase [Mycobacterium sp. IS-1742]KUI32862.1 methyltransferase type 12 [Mycobacterium sp. IS-1742]
MSSRHRLFTAFYRLGITPWDGHPLAASLRGLVEGDRALPPGTALDIGCGTGDTSIYLAEHGWTVTGADYVDKAVAKARAKAAAKGVTAGFVRADATRLSTEGVGSGFTLIVDNGCLHGMSGDDRDAYVREVTAVAAPGAHLVIVAFVPGGSFGVPGIEPAEIERRFAADWTLLSSGVESEMDRGGTGAARYYVFTRADS